MVMPTREAVVGPRIVVRGQVLDGHAVLHAEGRIQGVVPVAEIPDDARRRDVGPGLLAPGFVDVHTHGAGGRAFNEDDPEGHRAALQAYLAAGVTTLLPTLSSAPLDELLGALAAYESIRGHVNGPRIPGVHLEGPYFSQAQRGAQNPHALRRPDDGSIDQLLEHADAIRMISFAPELPGAVELTERLVGLGIIAAAGHSDARDTDLAACQRAGLSHVIHIVSGQSTTIRSGPYRQPGMLEATLASDDLTVEMIGDGKHLPATLMKLAFRCLQGRLCLVSDSTPGAGMPEGYHYQLGQKEFIVEGGVGVTMDRTSFAGSTTLISRMVPIVIEMAGIGVADAIAMATEIPARAARLTEVGSIAPGHHADLVLLDDQLTVRAVALGGVWQ
jgi:N-acetylglucosamine-6-phosphate deacetylase